MPSAAMRVSLPSRRDVGSHREFIVEATPRVIENKVVPGKGQREKAKNWQMEDSFYVPFINITN